MLSTSAVLVETFATPSYRAGGNLVMDFVSRPTRQPKWEAWSMEHLVHERVMALRNTIDPSTLQNYSSSLNSYLAFTRLHHLPTDPTEDSLSFFVVYMSRHISPKSVSTYLSGICQQLEPFFPEVRQIRHSKLVRKTLQGCLKMYSLPARRKEPLAVHHLQSIVSSFESQVPSHDDLLFLSMLITGFSALLRLGELSFPDDTSIRDWRKITRRASVWMTDDQYQFTLPFHKADRLFTGNEVLVQQTTRLLNPIFHFKRYLASRDRLLPLLSPLWLRSNGAVPTRSFFIRRLRVFLPSSFCGQSIRARGATWLAEQGVSPSLIQAMGRWSSDAFLIYIHKNPALLISLVFPHAT